MARWRKRPVVIEALVFTGKNIFDCEQFLGDDLIGVYGQPGAATLAIRTLEGEITASSGDYLIRGVNGEHYPCKPDIFDKTYEPAE